MVDIQDGRYSSGLYKKWCVSHMLGCPMYIHNTKKACFVRLRVAHMPPYIWMPPVCLDAPHVWMTPSMFGHAPCLNALIYLDTSICLMPPSMFGHPHFVWMPFVCLGAPICMDTPICLDAPICFDDILMPPVHTQHKDSMLCQTKGVSICPIHLDAPCT